MKGMKLMMIIMIIPIFIALLWDKFPIIKETVHSLLDPTAGNLLNWNLTGGMLILVLIITIITSILQKYATNQEELSRIKKEQKILQEEMKKYRENPQKLLELQKKSFEFFPQTMELTMKPAVYTLIPFILLFRWFMDYFSLIDFRFLGFMSWFWFYLISSIILSSVIRKALKIA